MWEEYETFHDRTGKLVVGGQSSSSFRAKRDQDLRAGSQFFLTKYGKRLEMLSQEDKLSKFCMDAGFLITIETGQSFMSKDSAEFSQFTDAVACREYILPRDEGTSEPKGWIRGNTKIGTLEPVTYEVMMEWASELSL